MAICKHCQAKLPENTRFCGRCGHFCDEETPELTSREAMTSTPFVGNAGRQGVADSPTVLLSSDIQQDQLQQEMQATYISQPVEATSEETENTVADIALGAIHLPNAQSVMEASAGQQGGVGSGQHGAHHQSQVEHGAHHQSQVEHGAHHQSQVEHGAHHQPQSIHGAHHQPQFQHGVHHQPQSIHEAHHQPQVQHGAHHQPQSIHGAHHQPQAAHGAGHQAKGMHSAAHHGKHLHGLKGCRPSCLTVTISTSVVLTFVVASVLIFFFYVLPGGASPTLSMPTSVDPGELVTVQGSNFSPGLHIFITLDTQQKAREDETASLSQANVLNAVQGLTRQHSQQGIPLTVKNDGTFTTTLQADSSWHAGSQHIVYISRQDGSLIVKKPFTIKEGSPALTLCSVSTSSASITLGPIVAGQNTSISTPFKLCSHGSGRVDWSSSWDTQQAPWLLLVHSGHVQAPQTQPLQFGASAASLKAGTYTTTVTFSSLHSSSKVTLKVTLIVQDQNAQTCIQPSTANLSLTGLPGQGTPVQQAVTINNCGDSGDWSAVITTDDGASWLSANPDHGTLQKGASQDITLAAVTTNLVAGTYIGHVTFGGGSTVSHIDVTLVVTTTPQMKPCLVVNTGRLGFTATASGSNPGAQGVTISNACGAGSWSAVMDQSWLALSATSGNINANGSSYINIQPSIANLAAGMYTGHVTFYPGVAMVTVILNVQPVPVPCISVQGSPLNLPAVMEGSTSASISETVSFSEGATCASTAWTAQSDVPWITLNTSSGYINAGTTSSISVNVNETLAGTGNLSGHITFSPGSGSSVMTINLTVYRKLCIGANPTSLSFTSTEGTSPASQTFLVNNCANAGTLSISNIATDVGGNWLSASIIGGGSLSVGSRVQFTVAVNGTTLSSGTYTGHIDVTITGIDGGTTTIRVNVTYIALNVIV